jgi:3-phenylpropionate/trans-cinnamate dioxygenase ferredoxin subunit
VATTADIKPGTNRAFQLAGHDVLICHTKDAFFAVENLCSHAMATLEGGRLRAYRLICPLHGASFDVRDGSVKGKPAIKGIRSYPVRISGDRVEVLLED